MPTLRKKKSQIKILHFHLKELVKETKPRVSDEGKQRLEQN